MWAQEVQRATGGRAAAEATVHLTLAFLGEADPAKAIAAARRVAGRAFTLPIDTSEYWRHNKIVWAGPGTMPPALHDLVQLLHQSLAAESFTLEKRPFAAHITLVRKAAQPKALPPLPRLAWPAREFVLVRSASTNTGSRYEPVERFPLDNG
jgi:2'-5' RNA ligase